MKGSEGKKKGKEEKFEDGLIDREREIKAVPACVFVWHRVCCVHRTFLLILVAEENRPRSAHTARDGGRGIRTSDSQGVGRCSGIGKSSR